MATKDERGTLDRRGFQDRTLQPRTDLGHGAIYSNINSNKRLNLKKEK